MAAVEFTNYSYIYHDGTSALDGIDLRIEHGEKVALIGPNGAGKSTMLLAMSVFIHGAGSVKIDGIEANGKNAKKVRAIIGSVLQNPDEQLFMPTVFDDVAFGPMNMKLSEQEVRARTLDALKTVGLEGMEKKGPHHLSAGQKRAAAIATILAMDTKIITMDEPDTSLDPRSRNRLVELLRSFDHTLIIATCNMEFAARVCDRAVLVNDGKIIADGDAKVLLRDKRLMEENGLETIGSAR